MHCLVQYVDDDILHIVTTRSMTEIEKNKLYWAPYKRFGFYEAVPISYSNDRQLLENTKKHLLTVQVKEKCIQTTADINIISVDPVRQKQISYSDNPIIDYVGSSESGQEGDNAVHNAADEIVQDNSKVHEIVQHIIPTGPITDGIEECDQLKTKISSHKRHFCYFCKKVLYQLPRHWFNVHLDEKDVKEIMFMHKNDPSRIKKINDLRKLVDFEYNKYSVNEFKIVGRKSNKNSTNHLPCPKCLGYFNKNNLRHHRKRCSPNKGDRSLKLMQGK